MISDSKRREVAAKLRGNPEDTLIPHRTGRHYGMGCHEAADRFWNMCYRIREAGNYDIAFSTTSVLADLIDPSGHECVPGECPLNVRHDNDRIDRDALLRLAKNLDAQAECRIKSNDIITRRRDRSHNMAVAKDFFGIARKIRNALGVES